MCINWLDGTSRLVPTFININVVTGIAACNSYFLFLILQVGKFRTKEDRADAELRQLLGSDLSDADSIHGTLPWRRQRKDVG